MSLVEGQPNKKFTIFKGGAKYRPDIGMSFPVVHNKINIYAAIVIGFDWYIVDGREMELLRMAVWMDRTSPSPTKVVNVLSGYTRLAAGHYVETAGLS